eukprot:tig00000692_g3240.t1
MADRDSVFCHVHRTRPLLDIAEDDWLTDKLPDEDIELPPGHTIPMDDMDDTLDRNPRAAENKWPDLGLQDLERT